MTTENGLPKVSLPERLAEKYKSKTIIRGLVQLIPFSVGSAAETALLTQATKQRDKRIEQFFLALEENRISISDEIVKSDDFVHKFLVTMGAAARTHRKEKIEVFAKLIANGGGPDTSTDVYDELLQIVDELSYREFNALSILDRFESENPQEKNENKLQRATKFWKDFQDEVIRTNELGTDEFTAFMSRIARTGCYELITGSFLDYSGGIGYLTPLYHRIKSLCADSKSEN